METHKNHYATRFILEMRQQTMKQRFVSQECNYGSSVAAWYDRLFSIAIIYSQTCLVGLKAAGRKGLKILGWAQAKHSPVCLCSSSSARWAYLSASSCARISKSKLHQHARAHLQVNVRVQGRNHLLLYFFQFSVKLNHFWPKTAACMPWHSFVKS